MYSAAQRKESPIIPELLDACVKKLYRQGMRRMFFDGVAKDVDELKRLGKLHFSLTATKLTDFLGFEEWARYRDVWKDT